jgi:hypothetical protein
MKLTLRVGALLLVAALAAACGGGAAQSNNQGSGSGGAKEKQDEGGANGGEGASGNQGGGSGGNSGAPAGAIVVRVKKGKVSGVEDTVEIAVGDEVDLVVSSDEPDEVHVHGYDVKDDVGPGEKAEIEFTADIPGEFEVELEEAGQLLFELQVR